MSDLIFPVYLNKKDQIRFLRYSFRNIFALIKDVLTVTLQQEIDEKARTIHAESYSMSIGELASMYENNELEIHPEFQRVFRWESAQRSKFIESILLGIPIPSIFVAQRDDGVWDVIDGVQRLSTIFEFMGIFRDDLGNIAPGSQLEETPYLKSLKGKQYENRLDPSNASTMSQRLYLKRGKIDIKIIKKESSSDVIYDLFQRINSLGTKLSDQELRDCAILMVSKDFFKWIKDLSEYPPFINCLDLSDKDFDEKFNREIASRFFVIQHADLNTIRKQSNFADFITDFFVKFWDSSEYDKEQEAIIFKQTFDLLNSTLGEESFKKYNISKGKFEGRFLVSAFEATAIGIAKNLNQWVYSEQTLPEVDQRLREKIIHMWADSAFTANIGRGVKFNARIPAVVEIGQNLFR
jgi:hypothetical protein